MPTPSLRACLSWSRSAWARTAPVGLPALLAVALSGCGETDDRSVGFAASGPSAPSASEAVNGTSSSGLPPSPATPDPVDTQRNPATLTPQSTGPTAPAP